MNTHISRAMRAIILDMLLLAFVTPAIAASITLENETWELLVIPADPSGETIETLFETSLPIIDYGQSWALFTYDSIAGRYVNPEIEDSLHPGQAFWLIQATGQSVGVELTHSLTDLTSAPEIICAANYECITVPLEAQSAPITWNLVGVPLSATTNTDTVLFVNTQTNQLCSNGCTLDEAFTNGQIAGPLWVYDSTAGSYFNATDTGVVPPGRGFWFGSLEPATQTAPALHLPAVEIEPDDCTWYVSPDGSEGNNGASSSSPLALVSDAIDLIEAGDTVCLMPGTYAAPITITNKTGTAAQPITLKSHDGNPGDVIIADGPASLTTGVEVTSSSHVNIIGLQIQEVLRGIQYNSVDGGSIANNVVTNIQQEGIRVGALQDSNGLAGSSASNITITSNLVENTGLRQGQNAQGYDYDEFGEGIYVGTGRYTGDATHDILVESNIVRNTTADSIEIKPYTTNITVSGNTISGSRLKYAGAISIAIGPETLENGNYEITGNKVYDVRSRQYSVAGIVIGQGNATVRDNIVWDIEGGRGIRIYTTFVLPGANNVVIENNKVWNPGQVNSSIAIHDGNGGFGLNSLATVTSAGNKTDDGSGGSLQLTADAFVGPLTGSADSGSGPGSGFNLSP